MRRLREGKESQQGICRPGKQSSPDEATLIRTVLQSQIKPLLHEVQVNRIAEAYYRDLDETGGF